MKKSKRNQFAALALVAAVAIPGSLSAQMGGMGGGMGGEGMGDGGMMQNTSRMMAYQPMHILHHGEPLNLSEAQRTELMSIMERANAVREENQASHDRHMGQMMELLGEPGSSAADIQAHFTAAHAAGGAAHWAQIEAAIQALAVLNDTQRARVDGWADMMDNMRRMHQGMGGMGDDDEDEEGEDNDAHQMGGMERHQS